MSAWEPGIVKGLIHACHFPWEQKRGCNLTFYPKYQVQFDFLPQILAHSPRRRGVALGSCAVVNPRRTGRVEICDGDKPFMKRCCDD